MKQIAQPEGISGEYVADTLRISMLGGFRMSFTGSAIPDTAWRLGKAKSMIKLLALAPERSLHREQIIELLWYDLSPEAGTNNFHQALHVARRTIASILPDIQPTEVLRLRQQILSLAPPVGIWTDVDAFEHLAASVQQPGELDTLYQAAEIYAGDLLPEDRYEEWTQERREHLREQYLALLIRIARIHENRREPTPAIDVLRRVVSIEPLREEAHAALMRVYALSDRRQQAIRQYERLRDVLEREVAASPDPVVTALYTAIEAGIYPREVWEPETIPAARDEKTFELSESIQTFLQRRTDFVGRETELQTIESALSGAIRTEGKIVLVAGEPGIGKTRLIEEFSRYARAQHIPVYWGRGYEGPGAPPYWPWVQIVREYLTGRNASTIARDMGAGAPDIARIVPDVLTILPGIASPLALDADQERFRLFDSLTTFLKNVASRTPLVLILDDLHWLDRSSLLMLEFLAAEMQGSRLMVIGSYRPVEVDRRHPLIRTLAELSRAGMGDRIHLDGLSPENVERYSELAIGDAPPEGLPEAIHFQTAGNPFFVREIVRLLVDEDRIHNPQDVRSWRLTIPHGIRETINLRADRLSEPAHRVLTAAAVAGQRFDLDVVTAVVGQSAAVVLDALDESLALGLVVEIPGSPGRFRFSHAITREALADGLNRIRQQHLHALTGEAIERIHASVIDGYVSELADHFTIASALGYTGKAIEYLILAGEQAMSRVAYDEAAGYFARAVALGESENTATPDERRDLLLREADAELAAGESEQAARTYLLVADLARADDAVETFAYAAIGHSEALFHMQLGTAGGLALLEEALSLLERDTTILSVRILKAIVGELLQAPVPDPLYRQRAERLAIEALDRAKSLADPEAEALALVAYHGAIQSKRALQEQLETSSRLAELAPRIGDPQVRFVASSMRYTDNLEAGKVPLAREALDEYLQLAESLRQPHNIWAARCRQATLAILAGGFSDAERIANDALKIGKRSAPSQASAVYVIQLLQIRREQDRASDLLELAEQALSDNHQLPFLRCNRVLLNCSAGCLDEARSEFEVLVGNNCAGVPGDLLWIPSIALLAEACTYLNDESRAGALYELLLPYEGRNVTGGGGVVCYGATSYYLGLLAMTRAQYGIAEAHLRDAIAFNLAMDAGPFVARSRLACALAIAARNDRLRFAEATELATSALVIARDLELLGLDRQVSTFLQEMNAAGAPG